jgi:hypothetical protein
MGSTLESLTLQAKWVTRPHLGKDRPVLSSNQVETRFLSIGTGAIAILWSFSRSASLLSQA